MSSSDDFILFKKEEEESYFLLSLTSRLLTVDVGDEALGAHFGNFSTNVYESSTRFSNKENFLKRFLN